MVLGKVFKAWYKIDKNSAYSLLLEKRNDKSQSLLFEAELIATLCKFNYHFFPIYYLN